MTDGSYSDYLPDSESGKALLRSYLAERMAQRLRDLPRFGLADNGAGTTGGVPLG